MEIFTVFTTSLKNINLEDSSYPVTGKASSIIIGAIVSHLADANIVNVIGGEKVILPSEYQGLFPRFSTIQSKCFKNLFT